MSAIYGIIGYPLTHSFSPSYFAKKFEEEKTGAVYKKFEIEDITAFPSLLQIYPDLKGLNVTIPYKQLILPYLDDLSAEANEIGAVNCIDIRGGKLIGYNTDMIGFRKSLLPLLKPLHKKALVFGTGGSALAVKYVLKHLAIEYLSVSRNGSKGQITYEALDNEIIKEHLLLINTTPLGMYPAIEDHPDIPYHALTENHLLYDLIYNPAQTKFLSIGKEKGANIKNGLEMLQLQAEASWDIWDQSDKPTV